MRENSGRQFYYNYNFDFPFRPSRSPAVREATLTKMQSLTPIAALLTLFAGVRSDPLFLGLGGSPSSGFTSRTGSSWPPYAGAGQGYWAAKAGFYGSRPKRSADPLYGGYGGVVGSLTPRTGPSYPGTSYSSRSFSNYGRLVRGKRSALYAGYGGVVGKNLTPRTGPSYPARSYSNRRSYINYGRLVRGKRSADPLYLGLGGVVGRDFPAVRPARANPSSAIRRSPAYVNRLRYFNRVRTQG